MQTQDTTNATAARELVDPALPLAHSGNTDAPGHWEAREAALVALRDEYVAEGWPMREAAGLALRHLDSRLEAAARIQIAPLMDQLCEAVDAARVKAAGDQRWLNAIDAAWDWLLQQDAVSYDHPTHALRVESASERGKVYTANGACQCRAFKQHAACWHRAAARLVRRALELRDAAESFALAGELAAASGYIADWDDCREKATAALPALLDCAAQWDRAASALGARIARAAMAIAA